MNSEAEDEELYEDEEEETVTLRTRSAKKKQGLKVKKKWSDENTARLISQVEMFPCVWDASSSDKKDLNRRDAAWQTIADTFADTEEKYTAKDCTAKWQSLRAIQRRILGEMKKKKSGSAASSEKPRWRFFQSMMFVPATESVHRTISESNLVNSIINSICMIFSCFFIVGILISQPETEIMEVSDSFDATDDTQPMTEDSTDQLTPLSTGVAKRKRKVSSVRSASACSVQSGSSIAIDENRENKQKALRVLDLALENMTNEKQDEFDIFGTFVASELRNISNKNAARKVKLKLQVNLANYLLELDESVADQSVQQKIVLLDDHGNQITDATTVNETLSQIPEYKMMGGEMLQPATLDGENGNLKSTEK